MRDLWRSPGSRRKMVHQNPLRSPGKPPKTPRHEDPRSPTIAPKTPTRQSLRSRLGRNAKSHRKKDRQDRQGPVNRPCRVVYAGLATLARGRRGGGSLRSHAVAAESREARRFALCAGPQAARWQRAHRFRQARTRVFSGFAVVRRGRWRRPSAVGGLRPSSPPPETTRPRGGPGAAHCHRAWSGWANQATEHEEVRRLTWRLHHTGGRKGRLPAPPGMSAGCSCNASRAPCALRSPARKTGSVARRSSPARRPTRGVPTLRVAPARFSGAL